MSVNPDGHVGVGASVNVRSLKPVAGLNVNPACIQVGVATGTPPSSH